MARDKIGSFMEASNVETWLNRWIQNYVNPNVDAGQDMKARFPLREAKVEVKEIPGKPGSYNAIAYLRPWLQMEELTTSLRMVATFLRWLDRADHLTGTYRRHRRDRQHHGRRSDDCRPLPEGGSTERAGRPAESVAAGTGPVRPVLRRAACRHCR
jgi:hypothetical protein